jgi:hypothetical protein
MTKPLTLRDYIDAEVSKAIDTWRGGAGVGWRQAVIAGTLRGVAAYQDRFHIEDVSTDELRELATWLLDNP